MSANQTYVVRWKGATSGPFDQQTIQRMLEAGEISLNHQLMKDGRWITVEEFAEISGWLSKPKAAALQKAPTSAVPAKRETQKISVQTSPAAPNKTSAFAPPTLPRLETQGPPAAAANIHVQRGGQVSGPYSSDQVKQMLDGGILSLSDEGWREGLANWVPLSSLVGLPPKSTGGSAASGVFAHAPKESDIERPEGVQTGTRALYVSVLLQWIAVNYLSSTMKSSEQVFSVIGGMIGVILYAFFVYKASKGRNWARIVLLILSIPSFFYAAMLLPLWFNQPTGVEGWFFKLHFFAAALQVGGIVWLFTPQVSRWYARIKAIRFAELLSDKS
jgi:hypothetical protein